MAMKQKKNVKNVIEAARAASLAAHSAAGLATASSFREAARLLRAAEALARSAVAVLNSSSTATSSAAAEPGDSSAVGSRTGTPPEDAAGGASGGPAGPRVVDARKRRRRRPNKEKMQKDPETEAMNGEKLGARGAGNGTSGRPRARALVRHETLPIPPASTASGSSSSPRCGTLGTLRGIVARAELNGVCVRFLRVDAGSGRYVVEPEIGGDLIRVKPEAFVSKQNG